MTGGAIDYKKATDSLQKMANRAPGTVSFGVRVPGDVAEVIDFLAEKSDTNRNVIVREALMAYFNKMAEQQNEEPKQ